MGINEATELYNEVDRMVIMWQGGILSDFNRSIFTCISKADDIGKAKLKTLFRVHVEAWEKWTQEPGYADDLRERLGKHPFLGAIEI